MSSDILSNYFSNFLSYRTHTSSFSPYKTYSKLNNNLSKYGILLSKSNILRFNHSTNKKIKEINLKIYNNIQKSSSLKNTLTFHNSALKTINLSETNYSSAKKNITNSGNKTLNNSRKKINLKINNSSFNNYKTNIIKFSSSNINLNSKFHLKNNIYDYNNNIEAEKIVKELMSLKTKKEISNHYKNNIKSKFQQKLFEKINKSKRKKYLISGIESSTISPMEYVKYNLKKYPYDEKKYHSFKDQKKIFGGIKNRNSFLDCINDYELNIENYIRIKGPSEYDIRKREKKLQTEEMNNMICWDADKKFFFNKDKNFHRKNQRKNQQTSLVDGNYKKLNFLIKSLLKGINYNFEERDEFIRKTKKHMSFDYRLNNVIMKAKKTLEELKKNQKINIK